MYIFPSLSLFRIVQEPCQPPGRLPPWTQGYLERFQTLGDWIGESVYDGRYETSTGGEWETPTCAVPTSVTVESHRRFRWVRPVYGLWVQRLGRGSLVSQNYTNLQGIESTAGKTNFLGINGKKFYWKIKCFIYNCLKIILFLPV